MNLRSDDMVLCTSHTYRAVRYSIDDSISRHNADVLCLDIPKHIRDEEQVIRLLIPKLGITRKNMIYSFFSLYAYMLFTV